MQTKLIRIFLCFILVFLNNACNQKCEHHSEEANKSCYPNNSKPSQIITYQEMADMMDAYDTGAKKELDRYMKKISNGKDTISTLYNWYKLDDLKQYIAYIEKISKEKNIPLTGFRIYPVSYPNNYSIKDLKGRQTIIFTPTTTIDGKDDAAFEPLYSENRKPVSIEVFLAKVRAAKTDKASFLNLSFQDDLESSSANRFKPVPPN